MKKISLFGLLSLWFYLMGTAWAQTSDQYYTAGNQLYAAKNYQMAAKYYQAAAQLNPNSAAAYQGLGNSYYQSGQNSQALDAYQKALALSPGNTALSNFVQALQAKISASPAAPASNMPAYTPTPSPQTYTSPSKSQKIELDIRAGLALSNLTGFGGGAGGYLALDKTLSLGADLSYYTFSSNGTSISFIELLAVGKYHFDFNGFKPYAFAGAGVADVSFFGASAIDPMVAIGGGAEFPMGKDLKFFGQVKYSVVLDSGGSATYLPVEAGISFNL